MKKIFVTKGIFICVVIIISLIIVDYINLPAILGVDISNINLDFWELILNNGIVIVLFLITYKKINKRTIESEKNKNQIAILMLKESYIECKNWLKNLNKEIKPGEKLIDSNIIPKVDFNSTDDKIMNRLKEAPFMQENLIMDLAKDGQINRIQIEKYLQIKQLYSQYISMRIMCFDAPDYYEDIELQLYDEIHEAIESLI